MEYEFPCYNFMESPSDAWDPIGDASSSSSVYSGILLKIADHGSSSSSDGGSSSVRSSRVFHVMFPRVQAFLRRHANKKQIENEEEDDESSYDLLQVGLFVSLSTVLALKR